MKKLVFTGAIIGFLLLSFFISDMFRPTPLAGAMTIVVVDEAGNNIHNDEIVYDEADTLFEIMNGEYNLLCANNQYQPSSCDETPLFGRVIMTIDTVETDWSNNYLAIYINDNYSTYGIDDIPLEDGNEYRFEYTLVGDEE